MYSNTQSIYLQTAIILSAFKFQICHVLVWISIFDLNTYKSKDEKEDSTIIHLNSDTMHGTNSETHALLGGSEWPWRLSENEFIVFSVPARAGKGNNIVSWDPLILKKTPAYPLHTLYNFVVSRTLI